MARVVTGENGAGLFDRALDVTGLSLLGPFFRTHAIAYERIDILCLHQAQGLIGAEIMSRPLQAGLADGLEGERILVDGDAANRALRGADDVVVDEQALHAEA